MEHLNSRRVSNKGFTNSHKTSGSYTNIAGEGTATQVDTYPWGEAWRAIDGNTDGSWKSDARYVCILDDNNFIQRLLNHLILTKIGYNDINQTKLKFITNTMRLW